MSLTAAELADFKRLKDEEAQRQGRAVQKQYKPGEIYAIKTADPSGRVITRYVGHEGSCWDQFNPGVRYVRRLLTPANR